MVDSRGDPRETVWYGYPQCRHPAAQPHHACARAPPQASRLEFLSAAGLRVDGRRPREVRRVRARLGLFAGVDGSAYYEQGNCKVVAVVHGPREVRRPTPIAYLCGRGVVGRGRRRGLPGFAAVHRWPAVLGPSTTLRW